MDSKKFMVNIMSVTILVLLVANLFVHSTELIKAAFVFTLLSSLIKDLIIEDYEKLNK